MTETVAELPEAQHEPYRAQETTPSGIEILYETKPKRQYRLRSPERPDGSHNYDWFEVPSVTEVLDVLKKEGLHWWGMERGVEGALMLVQAGLLRPLLMVGMDQVVMTVNTPEGWRPATTEDVVNLLKLQKLTVNDVRDKAGDRGQAAHDVLEMWATGTALDKLPPLDLFPPSEQGYIAGLYSFLKHLQAGDPEPIASEVMVGSLEHGFAGRYDVRVRTHKPCTVVKHITPVRGAQWAELEPGLYLKDLKTTKRIYGSHSRQLEAYEGASVECGYEPTDGRGVLLVQPDGTYVFKRSTATFEDFLAALEVWRSDQRMKERK